MTMNSFLLSGSGSVRKLSCTFLDKGDIVKKIGALQSLKGSCISLS